MEEDIQQLSNEDLKLLFESFSIVRTGEYPGSEVQLGFKMLFGEADKNSDGQVEKADFFQLMRGYFNSKHQKPTQLDIDMIYKKIDLNNDGRISFEEYDIFVRMIYETEYLPALDRELKRRNLHLTMHNH
ncbi:mitochondrial carrier family and ef hand protein [Stylonychia lemnae]|uniref:Mitochondrial carrier family and ef hand protein n=1 Tax=Stylonychia lemnae TaxID=5949 RepID=A0A078AWL4_STYLE|nr:mitochondrial carrier family and ef hand protein [Stylonychia lemnae]|eukprot:CDW86549.1 mitochondrial carrier family and ef hand protein [Stylonychia lemnae]